MSLLYGVHDEEGAVLLPQGAWCVALVYLSENSAPRNYRPDLNWLVRINWGGGSAGTIPLPGDLNKYLEALQRFAAGSTGIHTYIIGNEPNHAQERPGGVFITPQHYAQFYNAAYGLLKQLKSSNRITHAAPAPYHADPVPWTQYTKQLFHEIRHFPPDSLNCHAYLRGSHPHDVTDDVQMGGALEGTYAGFLTYLDFMECVPPAWRDKPLDITECNELLEQGWDDRNTGVVKELYRHASRVTTPHIRSISLYRYPNYDKWGFASKQGVLQDFREAIQNAPVSPQEGQGEALPPSPVRSDLKENIASPRASVAFERDIDSRATARGVNYLEISPSYTGPAWVAKRIRWYDTNEVRSIGPDHHILVDTQDEQGNRLVGTKVVYSWPDKTVTLPSEAKPGERWSSNLNMSPSRNEFSVYIQDSIPSETVFGIGMGADMGDGFNAAHHTSTEVIFQRVNISPQKGDKPGTVAPKPVQPTPIYPFRPGVKPLVTQVFGVNGENYKKFNLRGHNGIDFAVPVGTDILASDSGKVAEAGNDPEGYGLYIKIIHEWGETVYAHLLSLLVTVGDPVLKGQLIARSGNTGNSTGPHLHFALRVFPYNRNDGFLGFSDPLPYIQWSERDVQPSNYRQITDIIKQVAQETGLEWELLASLAWAESSFRPEIHDGLFQVGDETWSDFAENLGATDRNNPLHNARVGATYLKWLLGKLDNNLDKALIAYNFGIGRVLDGLTPPQLTLEYVNRVKSGRDLLKAVGT